MSSDETTSGQEDVKAGNGGKVKSLYVQLKPEVHEQLTLLAKVKGKPLAHEIREAIEAHVQASKSAPELAQQAQAALDEIERETAERKAAIANLLGSSGSDSQAEAGSGRSRRKPKDEDSSTS